ncbi:hypothetical protein EDB87DRAFT_1576934 [Lactarius vividus]|nr:hypothetical protein EDB87DRAFT_1576934 [Lactarius vividus]
MEKSARPLTFHISAERSAAHYVCSPVCYVHARPYQLDHCTPTNVATILTTPGALLRFGHGAHLSKEQAAELVKSWLKHRGVSSFISVIHGGGWPTVTSVPVSQANKLLGVLSTAACTTRAISALRGAPVPNILRPWHIQRYSSSTASAESCKWLPSGNEPSRATRTPSSSTTSSVSRTAHRRSAYRIVMEQDPPPENATALRNLFVQLDGWRTAMTASAKATARIAPEKSSLSSCIHTQAQVQLAHQTATEFRSVGCVARRAAMTLRLRSSGLLTLFSAPCTRKTVSAFLRSSGGMLAPTDKHELLDTRASFSVVSLRSASSIEQPADFQFTDPSSGGYNIFLASCLQMTRFDSALSTPGCTAKASLPPTT